MMNCKGLDEENGARDGSRTHNLLHLTLGFVAVHLEDKTVRLSLAKTLTLGSLTFWILSNLTFTQSALVSS